EDLLADNNLNEKEKANVSLTQNDYQNQKKLSSSFVRELSEATSSAFQAWVSARKNNSFAEFETDLAIIVGLKRRQADMMGFEAHPYDALLNEYEKGCTTTFLTEIFQKLSPALRELLEKISHCPQVNDDFLRASYPKEDQYTFGLNLLAKLGFDFNKGRQDISEHPFTTNFSATDVRLTTRISEDDFANMTWSCIHELGHGLYEQGLPDAEYGLPLGEYTSLGIHESQSRLWENNVGRSLSFWEHFLPILKEVFPQQLDGVDTDSFYKGINKVQASLIRTEADELTYHFHVIIRFEIEKALIEGTIQARDVPHFWNEQYKKLLGIEVPDNRLGCLQDVHWSHGSFGYFPTYSLGSLYAAQFFEAAKEKLANLENSMRAGHTNGLLNWLRENIHSKGRQFTSDELCRQVTGRPLDVNVFLSYADEKYGRIYDFNR
ncbi:MAG: carboxypeptidase M32, partial [Chitinophagaceae bacterium]